MTFVPRAAIETIQREGVPALEQMQRDQDSLYLDLTIILRWVCMYNLAILVKDDPSHVHVHVRKIVYNELLAVYFYNYCKKKNNVLHDIMIFFGQHTWNLLIMVL